MELRDVNLLDRDQYVKGVPHETFELLRREAPIFWHETDEEGGSGFWAVMRHKEVVEVNRDNIQWSSHEKTALTMESDEENLAQQRMMMLNMDPPMHTRYRLLVNKGFTPRHVNALEDNIRQLTNEIIDQVVEKGSADFVVDMAAELPLQVIAEVMGVPQEDRHKVFDWSNRMIGSEDPEYAVSPEHVMEASMELYAYANALAQQKRIEPGGDIISALLNSEVDGERLTELEFDLFFLLLAVAGNETTRNLISHAMLALIENPDQRQKLLDDPSLIPAAVEEMLRWGTPVMQFRRTAMNDAVLGGQEIKAGDKVVMWYMSANRDESMFDDPYNFDVTRTPNEHVAFGGGGPHFCLGANLARMEIRVMFQEVLRRLPDMQLAGPVDRLRSNFINGIKHMPVEFSPAKRES
jgi:cholest-4-en-3-one 26-monooxygenase